MNVNRIAKYLPPDPSDAPEHLAALASEALTNNFPAK